MTTGFVFLKITQPEIRELLWHMQWILSGAEPRHPVHVTLRGPYMHRIAPEILKNRRDRERRCARTHCESVGWDDSGSARKSCSFVSIVRTSAGSAGSETIRRSTVMNRTSRSTVDTTPRSRTESRTSSYANRWNSPVPNTSCGSTGGRVCISNQAELGHSDSVKRALRSGTDGRKRSFLRDSAGSWTSTGPRRHPRPSLMPPTQWRKGGIDRGSAWLAGIDADDLHRQ